MTSINIAGRQFCVSSISHPKYRKQTVLRMYFSSSDEFSSFDWDELPDDEIRIDGRRVEIHVAQPAGFFKSICPQKVKRWAKKWIEETGNEIAGRIQELEKRRRRHARRCCELAQKMLHDESILRLELNWNCRRQAWQSSRWEGRSVVIHTINDQCADETTRRPGDYFCRVVQKNAFVVSPNGRPGFRIHIIKAIHPAYHTDEEIAKLRARAGA